MEAAMSGTATTRTSNAAPVVLEGVRKEYEYGVVAVHGVDLEVHDGEFMGGLAVSGGRSHCFDREL